MALEEVAGMSEDQLLLIQGPVRTYILTIISLGLEKPTQ